MATAIVVNTHAVELANGNGVAVIAQSKSGNWYRLKCPANLTSNRYKTLLEKITAAGKMSTKHWEKLPPLPKLQNHLFVVPTEDSCPF